MHGAWRSSVLVFVRFCLGGHSVIAFLNTFWALIRYIATTSTLLYINLKVQLIQLAFYVYIISNNKPYMNEALMEWSISYLITITIWVWRLFYPGRALWIKRFWKTNLCSCSTRISRPSKTRTARYTYIEMCLPTMCLESSHLCISACVFMRFEMYIYCRYYMVESAMW